MKHRFTLHTVLALLFITIALPTFAQSPLPQSPPLEPSEIPLHMTTSPDVEWVIEAPESITWYADAPTAQINYGWVTPSPVLPISRSIDAPAIDWNQVTTLPYTERPDLYYPPAREMTREYIFIIAVSKKELRKFTQGQKSKRRNPPPIEYRY